MLRRLIFENWAILCTLIAFITALSIFLYIAYRALRMKRSDAARIANIPLEDEDRVLADRGEGTGSAKEVQTGVSEDDDAARHTNTVGHTDAAKDTGKTDVPQDKNDP